MRDSVGGIHGGAERSLVEVGGRIPYMDALRAYAIFAVIILHSASPMIYKFNLVALDWWWAGNLFDSATRSSVPLFFMISGALLLCPSRDESARLFFSKRMRRVLLPFAVWSLIYILWRAFNIPDAYQWPGAIKKILFKPAYFHLWFVYVLVGIYLLTPALRAMVRRFQDRKAMLDIVILVLLAFSAYIAASGGMKYLGYAGYVGYYLLGYRLASMDGGKSSIIWPVIVSACFLIIAFGTYFLTVLDRGRLNLFFYDFMSPVVVLMSISTFFIFKHLRFDKAGRGFLGVVKSFSLMSFGIYLSHVLIMDVIDLLGVDASFLHPLAGIPLTAAITAVAAFVAILLLKKIPYFGSVVD